MIDRSVVMRGCLLLALECGADYGFALRVRMGKMFGWDGGDPAFVYRTLRAMEEEGLLRSIWEGSDLGPRRRRYKVTAKGRRESLQLDAEIDEMAVVLMRHRAMRPGRIERTDKR